MVNSPGNLNLFFTVGIFVLIAVIYIYGSYCLARIGKKLGDLKTWKAWVPLVNSFYIIKLAGKSYWWFILLLIPIVNIVATAIIWAEIAKKLGKSAMHWIAMVIPGVNLIDMGYLAFSSPVDSNYAHEQMHSADHNVNQELVDYVKQSLAAGHDRASIKQGLISAGWPEQEIENVFKASGLP